MPMIEFAPDGFATAGYLDISVEPVDTLNEFRSCSRVQTLTVDDPYLARQI